MARPLDAIELSRSLIRFNTINPPGNERPCAEYLGGLLEDGGFTVSYHEFSESRTSLVACIGGTSDKLPLCFTGHLDVVPLGAAPWTVDPFAAEINGGKLYGRGSTDMKSGVAAFVVAALQAAEKLSQNGGVVLVITAGEETGCEGAYHLAGLDGILGEAGAIVVAEPTSNQPWVGHKGALWLKARTSGVTAHGSMPDQGVNAVYKAAHAITKLEDFDFNIRRNQILGKPTLNVGNIQGGMNINSVPDHAEIGIDIRTLPNQEHAKIRKDLSGYLGEDVDVQTLVDVGGVLSNPDDAWVVDVFDVMKNILGETPEVQAASYFTDASVLTPAYGGVPTIILGPGEAKMAHQTDEYCFVDKIGEAVQAYSEIINRWNMT